MWCSLKCFNRLRKILRQALYRKLNLEWIFGDFYWSHSWHSRVVFFISKAIYLKMGPCAPDGLLVPGAVCPAHPPTPTPHTPSLLRMHTVTEDDAIISTESPPACEMGSERRECGLYPFLFVCFKKTLTSPLFFAPPLESSLQAGL